MHANNLEIKNAHIIIIHYYYYYLASYEGQNVQKIHKRESRHASLPLPGQYGIKAHFPCLQWWQWKEKNRGNPN